MNLYSYKNSMLTIMKLLEPIETPQQTLKNRKLISAVLQDNKGAIF